MRYALLLILLAAPYLAGQTSREVKDLIREGKKTFENGDYTAALESYSQAFSLDDDARPVKIEGTFYEDYLPRYMIARCHFHLGNLREAEEWAVKSRDLKEGESVYRRKKRDLAAYNTTLDEILSEAEDYRTALNQRYNTGLEEARGLVATQKYDAAEQKLKSLVELDSSRNEASLELQNLPRAKDTYLQGRSLAVRNAILSERFDTASGLIDAMAAIDPAFRDIPVLRSELEGARERAAAAVIAANQPEEDPKPPVETRPDPEPTPVAETAPKTTPKPSGPDPREKARADRATLRAALLDSVALYRQGDPEGALEKLADVPDRLMRESASFHWLRGVYLLAKYHLDERPDESLLPRAESSLKRVASLQPGFSPDSSLYPDYVLDFYSEAASN